jgi:hypothetical protein
MSVILYIGLPLCWALVGKLLGLAVAASCFFSDRGRRAGQSVGRWCVPIFPLVFIALLTAGGSGNAGHGFQIFGSTELFDLLCGIPIYAIPALGLYTGGLYVVRDLTFGHNPSRE